MNTSLFLVKHIRIGQLVLALYFHEIATVCCLYHKVRLISLATVVCNCGNEFVTGSTKEEIHVEICSKCHSFYTGQQKAIKARGRIDMFNKKYGVQAN